MSSESNEERKSWVNRMWDRLPRGFRWNLEDTVMPENMVDRLLPGEEVQIEMHLAPYRDLLSKIMFGWFWTVFLLFTLATVATYFYMSFMGHPNILYAFIPSVIYVGLMILALYEYIEYHQWRLVKTNARLIISMPQHGSWPLIDNIEMKAIPKVIDTNWSRNPIWRIFQFFTGSRDVYISLTAFKFVEGTARVSDAIVLPDIMPEDVFELKRLVFDPE